MMAGQGHTQSWRAAGSRRQTARAVRPELWLLAVAVVGMLLVEVAQSSRMAQLSLSLDQSRVTLEQARARLEFVRADLDRRTTRAELVPLADQLGLAPLDARQVVALPAEYLAEPEGRVADDRSAIVPGWAERVSRVLVPEATARVRAGN
jgi:hypothetical protein